MNYIMLEGKRIELSTETVENLKKQLLPKKELGWKPKYKEEYYYVCSDGNVGNTFWYKYDTDNHRYNTGNCFKTREQAKKYKAYLEDDTQKQLALIRQYAIMNDDFEADWNDEGQLKYFLYYDNMDDMWREDFWTCRREGTTYMSKKCADELLEILNK